jgi:hypothetical protein
MSDPRSTLFRLYLSIESSLLDLEVKEVSYAVKRTSQLDQIIARTQSTISKTKLSINQLADSQIFGKDN